MHRPTPEIGINSVRKQPVRKGVAKEIWNFTCYWNRANSNEKREARYRKKKMRKRTRNVTINRQA